MTMVTVGRPHGYVRYMLENCRCQTCLIGTRRHDRVATGAEDPLMAPDELLTEPANHVQQLLGSGLTLEQLAALTHLDEIQLQAVASGRAQVRTELARWIYAVRLDEVFDPELETGFMDADYVWALVAGLERIGMTQAQIAQQFLGARQLALGRTRVIAKNGMALERAYRRLVGDPAVAAKRAKTKQMEAGQ